MPLLGAVDTALMGRLDNKLYLGALGLGSIMFSFIYWGFGFIRMASTGLTAQAYGEDNPKACGLLLQQSICLNRANYIADLDYAPQLT